MNKLRHRSIGAVAVEFAIVLVMLLTLVFAAIEFGRAMFVWSAAVDATRRGARTAAIVQMGDRAKIVDSMLLGISGLPDATVTIEYSADGKFDDTCSGRGSCEFVRVSISNYTFTTWMPFIPASIAMPAFSTTLPVEALGAT
jgi:hypothetical protein